jgi:hypothetical protein
MALLGLIHRTVLGRGPTHFKDFFKPDAQLMGARMDRHRMQLCEYTDGHWTDSASPNSGPAEYIPVAGKHR